MSERDPRIEPKPGDVLLPKRGFLKPTLVIRIVDVPTWDAVFYVQPFADKIMSVNFAKWREWMREATIIHQEQS